MSEPITPRCDELAREHARIMAGHRDAGVVQDWIALAQKLEREYAESRAIDGRRLQLYQDAMDKWKAFAQMLTGVDANDHGWLRAELESQWRKRDAYAEELAYVVRKAAEWDAESTDNADLAALGAYARAALAKNPMSSAPVANGPEVVQERGATAPERMSVTNPSEDTPNMSMDRTSIDYAIEHAGYFLDAFRRYDDAHEAAAVAADDYEAGKIGADEQDALILAECEAMGALRNAAHEFEKRRDRAHNVHSQGSLSPSVACKMIEDALRSYRCANQRDGEEHAEQGLPLVDVLSHGYPTIKQGEEELALLAEHLWDVLPPIQNEVHEI